MLGSSSKSFINHLGISSENHVGEAATYQLDYLRYVIFLMGVECVTHVTVEVLRMLCRISLQTATCTATVTFNDKVENVFVVIRF